MNKQYKKRLENQEKMHADRVVNDAQKSAYTHVSPLLTQEELCHQINQNLVQLEQDIDLFCFSIREIEDIINDQ